MFVEACACGGGAWGLVGVYVCTYVGEFVAAFSC